MAVITIFSPWPDPIHQKVAGSLVEIFILTRMTTLWRPTTQPTGAPREDLTANSKQSVRFVPQDNTLIHKGRRAI